MDVSERHLESWDIRLSRRYSPVYTFGGRRYDEHPFPPVSVEISATFDDNESAEAFEFAVRELLEKA